MANTYLTKTFGSAGNRKTWTWSAWVKKSAPTTSYQRLFLGEVDSNNSTAILFDGGGDDLRLYSFDSGATTIQLKLSAKLRDVSAWYHIVVTADTTQATASDRVKFYVNGVQETSLSDTTYPSLNYQFYINSNVYHNIASNSGASQAFNGSMSHIHFIDGTAYDATAFGEYDANGVWTIKTSPSVTYGTNGFFILKDGNSVTDQSGEGNDFTVGGGTLTKTEDSPSNVFATMNPLQNLPSANTYSQGNNTVTYTVDNDLAEATLGMTSGKWYWEQKYVNATGGNAMIGVGNEQAYLSGYLGQNTTGWSYYAPSGNKYHNASTSAYGDSYTTNDIIGIAFDADTRTIWFSKNGVWQNSATIAEIGSGTTTNSAYTSMGSAGDLFLPVTSGYNGNVISFNFGNGYFGTTAVTDAGINLSGIGIFEYDVPTGFTALSTKGLNL